MGAKTSIEWTSASWNPVRGCSRITPGCGGPNRQGGCYAEKIAARFSDPGQPFHGFATRTPHGGQWTGKLALVEEALTLPLRWKRPRRIFVNSMSDLFHENLPDAAIDRVFAVMALAHHHTFQVLTKRSGRMCRYMTDPQTPPRIVDQALRMSGLPHWWQWPMRNVWLGVSAEDQERADERIPDLLRTPAAVRFISAEPLLGPIDLRYVAADGIRECDALKGEHLFSDVPQGRRIDQVIAGAESGPRARDCDMGWIRALRDQCVSAGTAFFWKQHAKNGRKIPTPELDGQRWTQMPDIRHV